MKDLLTAEGKKWARAYYLSSIYVIKIPFIGKHLLGLLTISIVMYITNQGAKENVKRRSKTKVSGV